LHGVVFPKIETRLDAGIATIRRIESKEGPMMGYVSTLMRIESAFEKAGIRFIDNDAAGGIGVRFAAPKH
jgi:hypothetical protein